MTTYLIFWTLLGFFSTVDTKESACEHFRVARNVRVFEVNIETKRVREVVSCKNSEVELVYK